MKYAKAVGKIGLYSGALFGTYESIRNFSEGKLLEGAGLLAASGLVVLVERAISGYSDYRKANPDRPRHYRPRVITSADGIQSINVFDLEYTSEEREEILDVALSKVEYGK